MGGDALQIAGIHTAMAAMAYLSNIISGFLNALESLPRWLARRWDQGHGLTGPATPSGTYVTKGFRSRREDFAALRVPQRGRELIRLRKMPRLSSSRRTLLAG